jgi:hypothetical protein
MLFGVNNGCLLSEWYEPYQYIVWKKAESSNNKAVDTTWRLCCKSYNSAWRPQKTGQLCNVNQQIHSLKLMF